MTPVLTSTPTGTPMPDDPDPISAPHTLTYTLELDARQARRLAHWCWGWARPPVGPLTRRCTPLGWRGEALRLPGLDFVLPVRCLRAHLPEVVRAALPGQGLVFGPEGVELFPDDPDVVAVDDQTCLRRDADGRWMVDLVFVARAGMDGEWPPASP